MEVAFSFPVVRFMVDALRRLDIGNVIHILVSTSVSSKQFSKVTVKQPLT